MLAFGGPAVAHNGVGAAFTGRAGPYTIYAYDGYLSPSGRFAYRLVLLDASSGQPANDLSVAISAIGASGAPVHAPVQIYANVVFYELRNPYPHLWRVSVRVSGPAGSGVVAFPMHGAAPVADPAVSPSSPAGGGEPTWPWIAGGVALGVVVLGGVVALLRRRTSRYSADSS